MVIDCVVVETLQSLLDEMPNFLLLGPLGQDLFRIGLLRIHTDAEELV